jgi:phage/plasmid primase-like uncharacterized protein
VNHILSEHSSELAALAAECGIDWHQVTDLRPGIHKRLPVIASKYKGKCVMWIDEGTSTTGGTFIRITFHTQKHGGVSRSWVSHGRRRGPRLAAISSKTKNPGDGANRRTELFNVFKTAFAAAPRADAAHPYLKRKGIADLVTSFDIRVLSDYKVFGRGSVEPWLAFALQSPNGEYVGIQRIWANGSKKLSTSAWDGQYKCAHAIIGDPEASAIIHIAEGFATAASVHLATGSAAVFAISAGNLEPVACHIRERFEGKRIVIVADNDVRPAGEEHKGNPGVFKALEAARRSRTSIIVPPAPGGRATDANDIHLNEGLDRLAEVLKSPACRLKPAGNHSAYLLQVLRYARAQDHEALVGRLANATKAGWKFSKDELVKAVSEATEGRASPGMVAKKIAGVIWAGEKAARDLTSIRTADRRLSFKTVQHPEGHYIIPQEAAEAVLEHLEKGAMVVLVSPMGTGKTEIVIKEAMARVRRAALVLPRVSVVDDASTRLSKVKYSEVGKQDVIWQNQLITCVNSMDAPRFNSNGVNFFERLDLLCLDEAAQAISQMVQLGEIERRKGNTHAMIKAVSTAKAVLVADAHASEYTVNALRSMDHGREVVVVEVKHPSEAGKRWDIDVTESPEEVCKELLRCLESGEKCLLATDNKKMAMKIERLIRQRLPHVRLLNAHRDPNPDQKRLMATAFSNPNREFVKYDALIYTPVITAGVSITAPHFTRHFGIFCGAVKVTDILQMMARDRTARRWLISVRGTSVRMRQLAAEAERKLIEGATLYSDLKMATARHEVESRDNLLLLTLNLLKLGDHKVRMSKDPEKPAKEIRTALTEFGKKIDDERMDRILMQPGISESEYEGLRREWLPTDEQAAAMTAFQVRDRLCVDLTRANIEFLDKGGLGKVKLMEVVTSSESDVERFEWSQEGEDPTERYRAAEKKAVLGRMFRDLGISPSFDGEFTQSDSRKMLQWSIENADHLNHLFKGVIDPARPPRGATQFVQKILSLLGLELGKRKSNGRMIRFIDKTSLDKMLEVVNARRSQRQEFIKQSPKAVATPP